MLRILVGDLHVNASARPTAACVSCRAFRGPEHWGSLTRFQASADGLCPIAAAFDILLDKSSSDEELSAGIDLVVYAARGDEQALPTAEMDRLGRAHLPLCELLGVPAEVGLWLELVDEEQCTIGAVSLAVKGASALAAMVPADSSFAQPLGQSALARRGSIMTGTTSGSSAAAAVAMAAEAAAAAAKAARAAATEHTVAAAAVAPRETACTTAHAAASAAETMATAGPNANRCPSRCGYLGDASGQRPKLAPRAPRILQGQIIPRKTVTWADGCGLDCEESVHFLGSAAAVGVESDPDFGCSSSEEEASYPPGRMADGLSASLCLAAVNPLTAWAVREGISLEAFIPLLPDPVTVGSMPQPPFENTQPPTPPSPSPPLPPSRWPLPPPLATPAPHPRPFPPGGSGCSCSSVSEPVLSRTASSLLPSPPLPEPRPPTLQQPELRPVEDAMHHAMARGSQELEGLAQQSRQDIEAEPIPCISGQPCAPDPVGHERHVFSPLRRVERGMVEELPQSPEDQAHAEEQDAEDRAHAEDQDAEDQAHAKRAAWEAKVAAAAARVAAAAALEAAPEVPDDEAAQAPNDEAHAKRAAWEAKVAAAAALEAAPEWPASLIRDSSQSPGWLPRVQPPLERGQGAPAAEHVAVQLEVRCDTPVVADGPRVPPAPPCAQDSLEARRERLGRHPGRLQGAFLELSPLGGPAPSMQQQLVGGLRGSNPQWPCNSSALAAIAAELEQSLSWRRSADSAGMIAGTADGGQHGAHLPPDPTSAEGTPHPLGFPPEQPSVGAVVPLRQRARYRRT